jgi:hypothetical protein
MSVISAIWEAKVERFGLRLAIGKSETLSEK